VIFIQVACIFLSYVYSVWVPSRACIVQLFWVDFAQSCTYMYMNRLKRLFNIILWSEVNWTPPLILFPLSFSTRILEHCDSNNTHENYSRKRCSVQVRVFCVCSIATWVVFTAKQMYNYFVPSNNNMITGVPYTPAKLAICYCILHSANYMYIYM
jgi:hypothetical protein